MKSQNFWSKEVMSINKCLNTKMPKIGIRYVGAGFCPRMSDVFRLHPL